MIFLDLGVAQEKNVECMEERGRKNKKENESEEARLLLFC